MPRNHYFQKRCRQTGTGGISAIALSQPHTEEHVRRLMETTRVALVRLLEGTAEDIHIGRLGIDVNMGWVRAQQIGNAGPLEDIFERAGNALAEAAAIHDRHGRWGLTGPGRLALSEAVDAFEEVLRASSPRQMHEAEERVWRLTQAGNRAARRAAAASDRPGARP